MLDDALLSPSPTTAPRSARTAPDAPRDGAISPLREAGVGEVAAPVGDEVAPIRIGTLPGVYGPQADSFLLAQALRRESLRGARVLDLCTGSGLLAVTAARAGARDVVAVDVSRRAVLTARMNLRRNAGRGTVVRGDLLRAAPGGAFDVIVANPPYVPAHADELPTRGPARAWDGGRDGRAIVDRICTEAPGRLVPGGRLLVVHSHVCGEERTLELLREAGLEAEVLLRRRIAFGPVMHRRARFLRDTGLVAAGERHEQLVVVRAQRPRTDARPA